MKHILRTLFVVHALACCTAAQTVGQWELRKRTSTGMQSYGITAENGKAIGFTAGVPTMISLSGGTWGSITGTLSSQTDLQSALDAKASTASLSSYLTTATAASTYQPLDADLTAIAALTTTSFGRSLLTQATGAAVASLLSLDASSMPQFGGLIIARTDNEAATLVMSTTFPQAGAVTISTQYLTAERAHNVPNGNGTYVLTSNTDGTLANSTVTNAMLAGSIALSKLATTGTASASTYLRGDGAWSTIDLSAYLPLTGGTMTGVTTFAAGSVSAPSITFTGATSNTGIYCTGADTIDFAINGVRRVFIDFNGNIQTSGSGIQITNGNMISNSNYFSRGGAYYLGASDNCNISTGTGSPEGVVTAKVGSLYLRSDGGASTTLYVKESGTGNTGWVAK